MCFSFLPSLARRLRSSAAALRTDTSGAVAIIFALAAVPVIGLTGASLDYSRANEIRSSYQDAADAAVLAVASSGLANDQQRQALAREVFLANAPQRGHALRQVQLSDHDLGLHIRATGTVDTSVLGIIGVEHIDIGVDAVAAAAAEPLEISFVIDSTNSMLFGTRWETAYDALDAMLETLDDASGADDELFVTVVPMGDTVNVGSGRTDWVTGLAGERPSNNGRRGHWNDEEREGANDQGRRGNRDDDDDDDDDLLDPDDWEGCVLGREEPTAANPYRLTDATPDEVLFEANDHRRTYGIHRQWDMQCPHAIIGPSQDIRFVMGQVDDIWAAGTGRFDAGMAWGWRTVSANWNGEWGVTGYPARTDERRKVVVFISDGNSEMETVFFDGHNEYGYNNAGTEMLGNLVNVCTDMKEDGITIYMLFIEGNPHAESYMRDCASSPGHFFDVTRNEDMLAAFQTMGASLSQVRLVR